MQAPQPLPMSLQQFVHQQPTLLSEHLVDPTETRQYPYGTYWWRAIAGILLAGRVKPRHDRSPNMTDVNRLCKEANFNQYLFERMTKFLVNAQIIDVSKGQREYVPGEYTVAADRKFKALFTRAPHRSRYHPPPAAHSGHFPAPQRGATAPPERPAARRSTAPRDFGWCWTGGAGWGRGAPQGCPGGTASGRAAGKGGGERCKRDGQRSAV